MAKAIEKGCTGSTDTILKDWETDSYKDFAEAVAKVVTAVDTSCETEGADLF